MLRAVTLVALVASLGGCEAALGSGSPGDGVEPDAAPGHPLPDSSMQPDSTPQAACASGRKLYLDFDGVTIAQATDSDSTTNKAKWLTNASANVPAWRASSGTRATDITEIVDGVKARLTGTNIDVVTTRPTSGLYVMIALGGANTANSGTVGTVYSYATSYHDCGDAVKNDLGWVSDMTGATNEFVADLVIGAVGWGLGLDGTTDTAGCMCGWANGCSNAAGACTLSASIASSITSTAETACPNQNPQNEIAAFSTGFCAM
jgi:hypothetical protein